MKISINLGTSDVGTKAVVTSTWFFRTRVRTFICHQAGPVGGGKWICDDTGIAASDKMQYRLNESAQAAANLCLYADLAAHSAKYQGLPG